MLGIYNFAKSTLLLIVVTIVCKFVFATFVPYHTHTLDMLCKVKIKDEKEYEQHLETTFTKRQDLYQKCINDTLKKLGRQTFTVVESLDCSNMCTHIHNELVDKDNSLDKRQIEDRVADFYEYTSASKKYVKSIKRIFTDCLDDAEEEYKLERNRTKNNVGVCKLNKFYNECLGTFPNWTLGKDYFMKEFCNVE